MPDGKLPVEGERRVAPNVLERPYGITRDGEAVRAFALTHARGVRATILEYGGIVAELAAPDRTGALANVALGRPSLAAYEADSPYLGALIGRYHNRIRDASVAIDGTRHALTPNQEPHHLHGGARGFDKRVWRGEARGDADDPSLTLRYTSAAGEEGYPGTLRVAATYTLAATRRDACTLRVAFEATTDAPTVVGLTSHIYFQLAGEGAGTVYDQLLTIDADAYTPVDAGLVPTGEVAPVDGTPFDLRRGVPVGDVVRRDHPQIGHAKGVDHNFVLYGWEPGRAQRTRELRRAARLVDPRSGRTLEVHTVEPGLQVYTGNFLDGSLIGPSGRRYRQGDGIALESQNFPDAPNVAAFPDPRLRPGETYRSVTEYRFGVEGAG